MLKVARRRSLKRRNNTGSFDLHWPITKKVAEITQSRYWCSNGNYATGSAH